MAAPHFLKHGGLERRDPRKTMASLIVRDEDRRALAEAEFCMCCGQPSVVVRKHTFSWHPSWIIILVLLGLLPFLIAALITTKRKQLSIPLCSAHKNHWLWRQILIFGSLLLLIGVVVGGFILAVNLNSGRGRAGDQLGGFICMGGFLLGFAWLVMVALVQHTAIRPLEVTYTATTLTNVSEAFVSAYESPRRGFADDISQHIREHWRPGKVTRRGGKLDPNGGRPEDVTDLPPDAIQEVL
jgi:hypothetical protein